MKRRIEGGIYLIVNPSMDRQMMMNKLKEIIQEKIAAIQIWDNFCSNERDFGIVAEIIDLCVPKSIPVLINNRWELLKQFNLDGVHFDKIQNDLPQLKRELAKDFIAGVTCTNDLSAAKWAIENGLDYLSFCSMFPSSTSNSCELVRFSTVGEVAKLTTLPIFLAGGIKPENLDELAELNYSGIAVVSGIMDADKPNEAIRRLNEKIKINRNEDRNN